jgi:hypothetical protein
MSDSKDEGELVPGHRLTKAELDNDATLVLVLGIASIFFGLIGPVAFYLGRKYVGRCKEQDLAPESGAVVGMYIGLVTGILTALMVLLCGAWFLFVVLWFVLWFVFVFIAMFGSVLFL